MIKIHRIDKELPLPYYATGGSVGIDLFAREDVTIKIGHTAKIPLNTVVIHCPKGWSPYLFPRSSMPLRFGTQCEIGVIDLDYTGETDEICLVATYDILQHDWDTMKPKLSVTVKRGDRIAQLVFLPVLEQQSIVEVSLEDIKNKMPRGGFGSTG